MWKIPNKATTINEGMMQQLVGSSLPLVGVDEITFWSFGSLVNPIRKSVSLPACGIREKTGKVRQEELPATDRW